jgi:hypothetical protein
MTRYYTLQKIVLLVTATAAKAEEHPGSELMVTVESSLPRVNIDGDEYTATPSGFLLSHCVYNVPNYAHSRRDQITGELIVSASEVDGGDILATLPSCKPLVNLSNPVLKTHTFDISSSSHRAISNPLPPDYDGWLQYTAFNQTNTNFDNFTSTMSVPNIPEDTPQILYLFPGLQNIDWIPKVDPEPSTPFDIIQPVLQFPSGLRHQWSVRSWFVTLNEGALVSTEKYVASGDSIECAMTKVGAAKWVVKAVIASSGVETTQTAEDEDRLTAQPWAYNTVECYGCRKCKTYPTDNFTVSNCKLTAAGQAIDINWQANPKPAKELLCNERTDIVSGETVVFSFQ